MYNESLLTRKLVFDVCLGTAAAAAAAIYVVDNKVLEASRPMRMHNRPQSSLVAGAESEYRV